MAHWVILSLFLTSFSISNSFNSTIDGLLGFVYSTIVGNGRRASRTRSELTGTHFGRGRLAINVIFRPLLFLTHVSEPLSLKFTTLTIIVWVRITGQDGVARKLLGPVEELRQVKKSLRLLILVARRPCWKAL